MRAIVRPLVLLVLIGGFTAIAHSEGDGVAGANTVNFVNGSPTPTLSGVDVAVVQKAGANYTCIRIAIQVVDPSTGETIDSFIINYPGDIVSSSFVGLGSNAQVQVIVYAVFQSGSISDTKRIEAVVTTQ